MGTKSFTFTVNNYTDEDKESVQRLVDLSNTLFAALEVGEQGTPHIQGYITFKKAKRLAGVSKLLPRAHIETAKGAKGHNFDYIIKGLNKDGTPKTNSTVFINHDNGQQGERNDLASVYESARTRGIKRTAEDYPTQYGRNFKGIAAYLTAIAEPRSSYPSVVWLYGPTGIGKTAYAHMQTSQHNVYIAHMAPDWYDGLADHDWVILDEFDKRNFPTGKLLNLLDRYQLICPVKGGSVNFRASHIVITSSVHPQLLFPDTDYEQVYRRIDFIGYRSKFSDPWNFHLSTAKWPDSTNLSPETLALVPAGTLVENAQLPAPPGLPLPAAPAP